MAKIQTYKLMGHGGEPRNKPLLIRPINLQQRRQEYRTGSRLFNSAAKKARQLYMPENETGPLSDHNNKNKIKID